MKENRGLMTEGVIWKQLLLFALPLLLGNLFQQFYNTVDSIVVGNYIGANALASVGASTPIVNLMVGMFTGLGTGAGVVIAQFFGAEDHKGVHDGVHTTIALCIVSGLVMAVVGVALSPTILRLLDTPAEIMEGSVTYLQIYFMGVMALMDLQHGFGYPACGGRFQNAAVFFDGFQRGQHPVGPAVCYQGADGCCRCWPGRR